MMSKKSVMLLVLFGVFAVVHADVVARYNFNGRTKDGATISRLKADGPAKDKFGPDYVPNVEQKECGPVLKNPISLEKYYNASYMVDDGREILEQRVAHGHHPQAYCTAVAEGEAPLKAFTLEMVIAINNAFGVQTGGTKNNAVLFDNSQERIDVYNVDPKLGSFSLRISSGKSVQRVEDLRTGQYYQIALAADADGGVVFYLDGEKKAEMMAPAVSTRTAGFSLATKTATSEYKHAPGYMAFKLDDLALSDKALEPKDFVTKK